MIDFDIAKTWHRIYVEKLEFVAAGLIEEELSPAQIADDSACQLGQWLNGTGKGLQGLPAYDELRRVHERFHASASRYVAVSVGGGSEHGQRDAEADLREASARVVDAIAQLQLGLAQAPQDKAYASPFQVRPDTHRIAWNESLSVGVPVIDEHHKAIIAVLDKLMQPPGPSADAGAIVDALGELGKILKLHFAVEEALMRKLGMAPGACEAHRQEHADILREYAKLHGALRDDRNPKIEDIAALVEKWAIDHVVEFDFDIKKGHSG